MFSTFITLLILWIYDYKDCANREQKNVFLCRGAANLRNHSIEKQQKKNKKRLGEARKQVAEGATLKLVKEKSENKGSNRNDLSQKRVLFLFAEGELTASYSFLRGIVQARLPSALVSYVISLRSVLR